MPKNLVAVIGSGTLDVSEPAYSVAIKLGKQLIDNDFRIICGGLGGVMEAVCKGAHLSANYQEGDTIGILPTIDSASANPFVDIKITTGMTYARNQIIITSSDFVVAIKGGAGTLSELAFAWQYNKPIITIETTGGWARKLAKESIDERKREKIRGVKTVEDVIDILQKETRTKG